MMRLGLQGYGMTSMHVYRQALPVVPRVAVQSAGRPASVPMVRFWGEAHSSEASRKDETPKERRFIQYTPYNTACPLSTWHTFATAKAMAYHNKNAQTLQKYLSNSGEYYQDISWVKFGKPLGEVPYTVFDTETTGLKDYDRIIQIASSQVDKDHKVDHDQDFNTYVNPGRDATGHMFPINPAASRVHGITAADVADKPTIDGFLYNIRNERMKQTGLVVAYNAKFDTQFFNKAIDNWNRSPNRKQYGYLRPLEPALVLDPFVLIQRVHPFVSLSKRLTDHYEILMGKPFENQHDAQADVDGTVDVLKYTFKYLQKHSIPVEWAKFVERQLPKKKMLPKEKAAVIARFVRENRPYLEKHVPFKPQPLRITDILKFQHGSAVYHDDTGLPKLDISLNLFGWDGSKVWESKSDCLDPELALEVRQERDAENRAFLKRMLARKIPEAQLQSLASILMPILHPNLSVEKPEHTSALKALRRELTEALTEPFATDVMNKAMPQSDEAWPTWQATLNEKLEELLQKKLAGNQQAQSLKHPIQVARDTLISVTGVAAKEAMQTLGQRYFYSLVPIEPGKPLIDPGVLEMPMTQEEADRKRGKRPRRR